ncbi:chromosome alignment-maintaining phosphoprotein 1 [Haplochromis burtoni]|uniref:Chromosome alignment-maintaining phosphoprotein 1-like n=1 Tax=Haplochromis burtoni TaxID=8153 RepID=A0A3Q2X6N1_HAPBU|nr:chromosome alignment-maintaining phosphoprotein 1 [Haplochromis burtoni]XP_005932812.1 chromosome alignment-maintaining phosphoprotein 1 [Haplochromis burtoni]
MSVIIQTRGEVGGGVAAHLQCPHCGHFSKSHAHQLSHIAASHPSCLDGVVMGRLGNILMYQSGARLFHCSYCFYTSRDFTKLYKHIITKHCMDERDKGGDNGSEKGDEEDEEMKDATKRKQTIKTEEEEEEGKGDAKRKKSNEEEGEGGKDESKIKSIKTEEEEEGCRDVLKRKRSSEGEEEEEGEGVESVKCEYDDKSVLLFDGARYRCLICGWKNKLKAVGVSHVVRKHNIPKAYANQAIRRDLATANQMQSGGGVEEEEAAVAGLSGELLKEEMEATAKVVRFISNRFVCLMCGWKTKLKGFAISHVVRCHDVERPYSCKDCKRSFFLPSRLQRHISSAHRPGRYACPFCCFRSHFLGGFGRHCSRCNAREEEGDGGDGGAVEEEDNEEEEEEGEDRKETRGEKKRRSLGMVAAEEDDDQDEDDED